MPVVDRAVIEHIFGLKRRRAIELMHEFGGYQAGRTFLLDRVRLLEALQSLESQEDYTAEKRRRERLGDVVEASREHLILTRVRIPVRAAAVRPAWTDWRRESSCCLACFPSSSSTRSSYWKSSTGWRKPLAMTLSKFEGLLPRRRVNGKTILTQSIRYVRTVALLAPDINSQSTHR